MCRLCNRAPLFAGVQRPPLDSAGKVDDFHIMIIVVVIGSMKALSARIFERPVDVAACVGCVGWFAVAVAGCGLVMWRRFPFAFVTDTKRDITLSEGELKLLYVMLE